MTASTKKALSLLAAPLVCLLCPAHLLGFLAVPLGLRATALSTPHTWREEVLWALGALALVAILWFAHSRWHRTHGHSHDCRHDSHAIQKNNTALGDIAGGDIYK